MALLLLGIVAAASAPLVASGLKATQVGRYQTQAKNLLQQRIDVLRNLQFRVPYTTTANEAFVDLLDTYFRNVSGASNSHCTSSAYYGAATSLPANAAQNLPARSYPAGTYVCSNPTVPVRPAGPDLPPQFNEDVQARFIDAAGTTVLPPNGSTPGVPAFDTQTSLADVPPTGIVELVATVRWRAGGVTKQYSSTTDRSEYKAALPLAVSRLRTNALTVETTVDDLPTPTLQRFAAAVVSADTSLAVGATARAVAQGAVASYSSGELTSGQATGALDAPDDQPSFTALTGASSSGVPCGSTACFGTTRVSGLTGSASAGLPQVASSSAPITSVLSRGTTPLVVSNVATGAVQARLTNLSVQSAASPPTAGAPTPLVRQSAGSGSGFAASCDSAGTAATGVEFATSTGFVQSTAGASHAVTVCTTSTTQSVEILPTASAPQGMVNVTLDYAGLRCTSGTTPAATAFYQVTIRYYNGSGYSAPIVLKNGSGTSLPPTLLVRGPGGVQVGTSSSGTALYLGDYIQSMTGPALSTNTTAPTSQQDLKVLTLSTVPTRDADATGASRLNVVVGDLGCFAQDNR